VKPAARAGVWAATVARPPAVTAAAAATAYLPNDVIM
jgi:hypothetical protein